MAARRRIAARRGWPANLYLNSKGYYYFRNPKTGKTYGLGKDLKVATANARHANAELLRREDDVSLMDRIDGGGDTLTSWCDTYLASREATIKGSTFRSLKSHIAAIKASPFAGEQIARITPRHIADFVKERATTQPQTALRLRSLLRDLFRAAIEHGMLKLGENPVAPTLTPTVSVSRNRLSLDDYKAILAEARKDPLMCWAANAIELALHTAQRREDIVAMRFDHWKDGYLWVVQHKGKNPSKLKIPTTIGLKATGTTIEDVLKRCRDNVVSKNVVHFVRHHAGTKPGASPSLSHLSETFAKLRDRANIVTPEGKTPASLHELRSLAARLYADEHGKEFAQALLGHKSAEMTALYRDSRGTEWTEVKIVER